MSNQHIPPNQTNIHTYITYTRIYMSKMKNQPLDTPSPLPPPMKENETTRRRLNDRIPKKSKPMAVSKPHEEVT